MIATLNHVKHRQSAEHNARDIDTVLFQNRDAVKTLGKILDCPCSADQDVALACYLAATKVVAWYEAAMDISGNAPDGSGDMSQGMSDRIVARPIFMGGYCLNAEAGRAVRAKVVLMEMTEHVQPLISRLPKHHVSDSDRLERTFMSSPSPTSEYSGSQPCMLRDQLRKIVKEADNVSRAA